jgi:hypothetical protein
LRGIRWWRSRSVRWLALRQFRQSRSRNSASSLGTSSPMAASRSCTTSVATTRLAPCRRSRTSFTCGPAGARIRREFLRKRVLCDVRKLDRTRDPKSCRRSQVGTGRVLVDARPFITEQIPADLWLFLARGTTRKTVASLAILGKQDQSAPVVRDIPVVRDFRAPIVFMNELTKDGRYGYKLVFRQQPDRCRRGELQHRRDPRREHGVHADEQKRYVLNAPEWQVREEEGQKEEAVLVHAAELPCDGQGQLRGVLRLSVASGHREDYRAFLSALPSLTA